MTKPLREHDFTLERAKQYHKESRWPMKRGHPSKRNDRMYMLRAEFIRRLRGAKIPVVDKYIKPNLNNTWWYDYENLSPAEIVMEYEEEVDMSDE
jgi:hypothetical protein